jgi:hypothetical protein
MPAIREFLENVRGLAMDSLYKTVISLASLGFAGVGLVIFLLIFVLLMKGGPVDVPTAKLRNRYLTLGVGFAAFCGVLTLVSTLLAPKETFTPTKLTLTFAPEFADEQLPEPVLRTEKATFKPDQEIIFEGGMVKVSVGAALNEIKRLKILTTETSNTATAYREQRDQLAKIVLTPPSATGTEAIPVPVDPALAATSANSAQMEKALTKAVGNGDIAAAAIASANLRKARDASQIAIKRITQR